MKGINWRRGEVASPALVSGAKERGLLLPRVVRWEE